MLPIVSPFTKMPPALATNLGTGTVRFSMSITEDWRLGGQRRRFGESLQG